MSATNHTSNYNLPIYEAGNTANWLVDFNGAMNTIDRSMNENKLAGDTLKTDMEELQTDFQQVGTKADAAEHAATQASQNAANALTIANNATTIAGDAQVDAHAALNLLSDTGTLYTFESTLYVNSYIRKRPLFTEYKASLHLTKTNTANTQIGNSSVIYDNSVTPVEIEGFNGPRIRWICDVLIGVNANVGNATELHSLYILTDANNKSQFALAMAYPIYETYDIYCESISIVFNDIEIPTILESELVNTKNIMPLPRANIVLDLHKDFVFGN